MIPRISVVMSVYNGERYLREAVESILDQTFTDLEFIIVDDGSTDGTWGVLNSYDDPRIRLVRNAKNIGLTRSLNKGLAQAQGEYVARQDADDVSLPERLAKQVGFLDQHPAVALVGTAAIVVDAEGNEIGRWRRPVTNTEIQMDLLWINCFWHGSVVFRREIVNTAGAYREEFTTAQDYDLWLRVAERYEVANLAEPLYVYRCLTTSITGSMKAAQTGCAARAVEQAIARRQTGKHSLGRLQDVALSRHYLYRALETCARGDGQQSAEYLARSLQTDARTATDENILVSQLRYLGSEVYPDRTPATGGFQIARRFFAQAAGGFDFARVRRRTLAHLAVASAFERYERGDWPGVWRGLCYAVAHEPSWLRNRGLLVIGLRSLWRAMVTTGA